MKRFTNMMDLPHDGHLPDLWERQGPSHKFAPLNPTHTLVALDTFLRHLPRCFEIIRRGVTISLNFGSGEALPVHGGLPTCNGHLPDSRDGRDRPTNLHPRAQPIIWWPETLLRHLPRCFEIIREEGGGYHNLRLRERCGVSRTWWTSHM